MSNFYAVATLAVIVGLGLTAIMALVRIVRGPTILDRMVASDVLLTTLVLAIGSNMVVQGHTVGIVLMAAIAATSVLATIVVARYVRRRTQLPGGDANKRRSKRSRSRRRSNHV